MKYQARLLKKHRETKKLTQAFVAEKAGVHRQFICKIEKGKHNISPKLSSALRGMGVTKKSIVQAYLDDVKIKAEKMF